MAWPALTTNLITLFQQLQVGAFGVSPLSLRPVTNTWTMLGGSTLSYYYAAKA
ncbi:hypothetical protein FC81_GL000573 [Liquorilactobacillus capillatus DSM 19910]|uniref:Uncharacterized protein n=1 Tax=Liquorilactobacillus capillatus DSM 19910 TaxID=1423731 RepID=A0A0R1M3Y4_9LACO|nr:hypothetical protein FC81_GL000573 [Liquorilactobacillus capillatus DSM 19910]